MSEFRPKMKIPTHVLPFLCYFAKRQWFAFVCTAVIAAAVNVANTTIWPLITGNLVDTFSSLEQQRSNTIDLINKPLVVAFCFWVFMECMNRFKGFLFAYRLPKFEASIRLETFEYVAKHSHQYFLNRYIGAVAHRVDDLPRSARFVLDEIVVVFFPTLLSVCISSSIMFVLDPLLSLVFAIWFSCYTIVAVVFCGRAAKYSSVESDSRAILQGGIVDVIRNNLSVRIFNAFKYEREIISELQNDEVKKYKFTLVYMEKLKIILSFLNAIGVVCLFYVAIYLWRCSVITVGDLTYVATGVLGVLSIMGFASDELTYAFSEVGICRQSLSIIDDPYKVQYNEKAPDLIVSKGVIEFKDVHFQYPDSNNSFHIEKLHIGENETVGLVGFSGSCKTTFIQLLLRLFEIKEGQIAIDGQNIAQVNLASLRDSIAFIQQDPILFHRSIMDNIRYGDLNATDDEILQAATKAHCKEFINSIPGKFNAIVGETGTKLSSGQKQRIAIARAILKNSKILLMDEATSSLDSDTENEVQRGMEFLMREKTVIIIAHRLSTLTGVDRLLVFHEGRVVEDGRHDELLKKGGYYAKLWETQQ